jgi:putative addiction module CopG family antidote
MQSIVERLGTSGGYSSQTDVLNEGVRRVAEREKRLDALVSALVRGLADADADRSMRRKWCLRS